MLGWKVCLSVHLQCRTGSARTCVGIIGYMVSGISQLILQWTFRLQNQRLYTDFWFSSAQPILVQAN